MLKYIFHTVLPSNLSPYLNRTVLHDHFFESKFSKTTRQKFIVYIFSDRVNLALLESFLTFNICREVF